MRNRLLNPKAWIAAGAIALSISIATPLGLSWQRAEIAARGRYSEASWNRYEYHAWRLVRLAILFSSISGFLTVALLPERLDGFRRQILKQAIEARLKDPKPLSEEELQGLHVFLEEIDDEITK
ncbi:MAG: hypothetical protein VKK04_25635 [Synechococcales bacterium]|nr:hypothetical protein [Synechococcales bacterium]